MNIESELQKVTICTQEYYGQEDSYPVFHYKVTANNYEYNVSSHKDLKEISEQSVIEHIVGKICSKKEYLKKAFDIISYNEEECYMPLCEDDALMGESKDIRILLDEEETYVYGRDFHFVMISFIKKHFDEKLIDILTGE